MKLKLEDGVDVNVRLDIPTQDLEDLIEKLTEATLVVIGALTVSHILKRGLRK